MSGSPLSLAGPVSPSGAPPDLAARKLFVYSLPPAEGAAGLRWRLEACLSPFGALDDV